ncbi:heme o synthase [Photobacterium aquimaris]|uniref:Protoheme IX farnesyltransferase n=1 Tax=Photobacterium aquimaris TaxID=512643 RepID=A0A2T3I1N3_9GAMM|nr:heme o synthase [Photobacterium aquimaris]MCP4956139.1 protoheme IX farnesyltransferase [Photobacterium aquimaris]OBU16693.1 protoheme IX farnesyltransferase [Photobacterium aquimaris]PQJ37473.1 protoheme IX farnesyltransferase [Photobacterium aquimaris]PSU11870.1 protoheme IX farnesyltransferase [Photobacterium aquimaris]
MDKLQWPERSRGVTLTTAVWRDYLTMTKPKVVAMLLLTALVGMCLAVPTVPTLKVVVFGLAGIGLQSAAAAVFNHVLDRRFDAQMARTYHRPLAKGRIATVNAVLFASVLMVSGFLLLWQLNPLTAWLTMASLVGYALVYTVWLKHATPQNIVIGGLAGAAPPLLGWVAVTGSVNPHALLLVMLVFVWTPPHFWALAIHRRDDYAKAGIPMLPVTHGIEYTKTMVLFYTLLLFAVGLLPWLTGMSGGIYLIGSSLLNLGFIGYAIKLKFFDNAGHAWATFNYSIWHILALFVVLLVDHWWLAFIPG